MSEKFLITGASGLVGTRITELLQQEKAAVTHLVRSPKPGGVPQYGWNPEQQKIDPTALEGVSTIIHLAGADVADKRWTPSRKKELYDSRIQSTRLLVETLRQQRGTVTTIVAASAIGYYGFGTDTKIFSEDDAPADDFLATLTRDWEHEIDEARALGIRVVKLRIGIVLSHRGGALQQLVRPIRWGVGAALGNGQQFLSWIDLDDLCRMFLFAARTPSVAGAYNATVDWCTNTELTKAAAKLLNKPLFLPPVPAAVLRLMLGEMATIVVEGSRVSGKKIKSAGMTFQYPTLAASLQHQLR